MILLDPRKARRYAAPGLALALAVIALLRTAWLCDDAYITLRTVDNFANGFGLRWNVDERVQTYTHPLWMLALTAAYAVSGDPYDTALYLGIVTSSAAVSVLILGVAATPASGALAAGLLLCSRAFVDFSTSGLENPLTHLLLGLYGWAALRVEGPRRTLWLALIASLLGTTRLDAFLIALPALGFEVWDRRDRAGLARLAIGLSPLLLWEGFSVVYYGFPIPNTAYAKLGTGIPHADLAVRGLAYLWDAVARDPATPILIAAGTGLALRPRRLRAALLALGGWCYLAYTVFIGGDFMSGRLLTPPLYLSVALIAASLSLPSALQRAGAALGLVAYTAAAAGAPLRSGPDYPPAGAVVVDRGAADERGVYYQQTGLFRASQRVPRIRHGWAEMGLGFRRELESGPLQMSVGMPDGSLLVPAGQGTAAAVVVCSNVGFTGFFAGPRLHIVDALAIADPLLARLPAYEDPDWRVGHYRRIIPRGYVQALADTSRTVADPAVDELWRTLRRITRGPLFSADRWAAILQANLGGLGLADDEAYRRPSRTERCRTAAVTRPLQAERWVDLGRSQLEGGERAEGVQSLQMALRLGPESFEVVSAVGEAYRANGEDRRAAACFERALRLAPEHLRILEVRGEFESLAAARRQVEAARLAVEPMREGR